MKQFLIITADDFGLKETVNEAVEQGSRLGLLSAASLMMGEAATADAVRRARALPGLRVGLHIVLADGQSVLPPKCIPALVDATGRMNGRLFVNALRFAAEPRVRQQLEAEIRAQFSAFALTGLPLDHVNVHKHLHLNPIVLAIILRVGREFGMSAMRIPDEPLRVAAMTRAWSPLIYNLLLKPWVRAMRYRVRAAGLVCNDTIVGVAASGALTEDYLLGVLAKLPQGVTEIYLHPCSESGALVAPSMHRYRHADELSALLSPRVRQLVASLGIGHGGYTDIPTAMRSLRSPAASGRFRTGN